MLNFYLNTLWLLMALAVCWTYANIIYQNGINDSKIILYGICFVSGAITILRGYWLPWFWYDAIGMPIDTIAAKFDNFWPHFGNEILTAGMLACIVGFYFLLHLFAASGNIWKSVKGFVLMLIAAAVPSALAYWVRSS